MPPRRRPPRLTRTAAPLPEPAPVAVAASVPHTTPALDPVPEPDPVPASDADALARQLREREELIGVLTERLEETAEQLDRFQRTVGDRGRFAAPPASGLPSELVERQRGLCEEMEQAVRRWDELQCAASLGRIETQLGELRDLVTRHPVIAPTAGMATAGMATSPAPSPPPAFVPRISSASSPVLSGWEAVKASLLGDEYLPPEPDAALVAVTDGNALAATVPVGDDPFAALPDLPAAPAADADREELRRAVIVRDELIAGLLGRLRVAEGRTRPDDGWKRLEAAPEELRTRLESLEDRLDGALRAAEMELSLERARLGREAVRLRGLEDRAQRADRSQAAGDAPAGTDRDSAGDAADARWRRMLGGKRDR